jgi:hypothetical protein
MAIFIIIRKFDPTVCQELLLAADRFFAFFLEITIDCSIATGFVTIMARRVSPVRPMSLMPAFSASFWRNNSSDVMEKDKDFFKLVNRWRVS